MKKIRRAAASVYNFFNMFHKDNGAHFTYNIGVSMMRMGLLCLIIAIVIGLEFFFVDTPRISRKDEVIAMVTSCYMNETGVSGEVSFYGKGEDGYAFRVTQRCTFFGYHAFNKRCGNGKAYTYTRYSVEGGGDYITDIPRIFVNTGYHLAYPDSPQPVPILLIPIAVILSVISFIMGSRQINVAMKYPRNDIPEELSGAPAVVGAQTYDTQDIPQAAQQYDDEPGYEDDGITFDEVQTDFHDRPYTY